MILDLSSGRYPSAEIPWLGVGYIATWTSAEEDVPEPVTPTAPAPIVLGGRYDVIRLGGRF